MQCPDEPHYHCSDCRRPVLMATLFKGNTTDDDLFIKPRCPYCRAEQPFFVINLQAIPDESPIESLSLDALPPLSLN